MSKEKERLQRLATNVEESLDFLSALRKFTGEPTAATCTRLGLSRTSVHTMARATYGRREDTTRRALEVGLGIPLYSLDNLLPEGGTE